MGSNTFVRTSMPRARGMKKRSASAMTADTPPPPPPPPQEEDKTKKTDQKRRSRTPTKSRLSAAHVKTESVSSSVEEPPMKRRMSGLDGKPRKERRKIIKHRRRVRFLRAQKPFADRCGRVEDVEKDHAKHLPSSMRSKALARASRQKDRGVLYVGRLPDDFHDEQLRSFFSQFGKVTRVRMSKSQSGKSRHFAFVEFSVPEVAEIAAESMNHYLMYGKMIRCQVVPPEKVHMDLFRNAGRFFRPKFAKNREKRISEFNQDRTEKAAVSHVKHLLAREKSKRSALAALGIKYQFPGYKSEVTREFPALLESKPSVTLSPRNEQKKKGKSNIQGKTESATKNATAQRKRSASQISKGQQNVVQGKSKGSETKPVATGPQKRRKRST